MHASAAPESELSLDSLVTVALAPRSSAHHSMFHRVLGNGLHALLMPDPTSRLVTSVVVVRGGSAAETPRVSGASHFLEHMLFNGTERRTQQRLYADSDEIAAFNNAFTRRTHVAFMITVPGVYAGRALEIQSDMLFHSTLPSENFEKERGIILEEMAKDRDTEAYLRERLLEAETNPGSTYATPVLGSESSIREMDRQAALDFYQRYYVPERMTAIILGGFDPDTMLDSLEATLGAGFPSHSAVPDPVPPAPIVSDEIVRHAVPFSSSHLRIVWDAPSPDSRLTLAADALVDLWMGGDSSPVARSVAGRMPGSVRAWSGRVEAGPGFARIVLDVDLDTGASLDALHAAILDEVAMAAAPDDGMLQSWKTAARAADLSARERSYMYGPQVSEQIALCGAAGFVTRFERIAALTVQDLSEVLTGLRAAPRRAILVDANVLNGNVITPTPQAFSEATDEAPYRPSVLTTGAGARVLLLKTPRGGLASVYVLLEGRNYLEPEGREGITEFLHRIFEFGPARMGANEFDTALRGMGAELQAADQAALPFDDYYSGPDFSFVRLQVFSEDLERGFNLLADILRKPRIDDETIAAVRGEMLARAAREASSSRRAARDTLSVLLYGRDHPQARSPFGFAPSIERITAEDLHEHLSRLLDPKRVWVAFAADVEPEDATRWVDAIFPPRSDLSPTLGMTETRFRQWTERRRAGETLAGRLTPAPRIALPASGDMGYALDAALLPRGIAEHDARTATEILSGRVAFRIRESLGMAYTIGASLERVGDRLIYVAAASTRRENAPILMSELEAVRRQTTSGRDDGEVTRAGRALYGSLLRRQESRLNQAMQAVWAARDDRDPLDWWRRADEYRDVDPAAVNSALDAIATADTTVVIVVR